MIYVIKGETGELYNGTLDEWYVGATDDEEEAKDWVDRANTLLIEYGLHKSSRRSHGAYKRGWKPFFDNKFKSVYNGSNYWYFSVDELDNQFE